MNDILSAYKLIMKQLISNDEKRKFDELYEKKNIKLNEVLADYDAIAAKKLWQQGYSFKEIKKLIAKGILLKRYGLANKDNSLFDTRAYSDSIMKSLGGVVKQPLNNLKLEKQAEKLYLAKTGSILNKYSGYNELNEYQIGKIAVSMLDMFPANIMKNIIKKHTKSTEYANKIILAAETVIKRYQWIEQQETAAGNNSINLYRRFAKTYMNEVGAAKINSKDEQNIIRQLLMQGCSNLEIEQALQTASPIAVELGRDIKKYIAVSLVKANEAVLEEKIQIEKAAKRYNAKKQDIDISKFNDNKQYYMIKFFKELLREKYTEQSIKAFITKEESAENVEKLLQSAQKIINAEEQIIQADQKIPQGMDYSSLKKMGITANDLYRNAINERIKTYPSTRLFLSAKFIDNDVCEKLLNQYQDFDLSELKKAILECSPRVQNDGVEKQNYAERIFQAVQDRNIALQNQLKNVGIDVQKEYLRQCGLATEGVSAEANMEQYHAGRAAVKMLQKNIPEEQIKAMLISSMANELSQIEKNKYAEEIIMRSRKTIARLQLIAEPSKTELREEKTSRAEKLYMEKMNEEYRKKHFVSSTTDIDAALFMLLDNISKGQIIETLTKNSPVAIEPGRDDNYMKYVTEQAELKLQQERMKLESYKLVPRIPFDNIEQEYEYHLQILKNKVNLPDFEIAGIKNCEIASILLEEGFQKKTVEQAILNSPVRDKNNDYGIQTVKAAQKNIGKNNGQDLDVGLSLSLNRFNE